MKFEVRIKINKSAEGVYKAMLNTQLMTKWESNFNSFQMVKGGKRKMNSEAFRIYKEPDDSIFKIKEIVTELKKDKLFAYQLVQDNFMSYIRCRIIDKGEQVLLVEETEVKFRPAILGIFGIFMKNSMKKKRTEDLLKFKELLEGK